MFFLFFFFYLQPHFGGVQGEGADVGDAGGRPGAEELDGCRRGHLGGLQAHHGRGGCKGRRRGFVQAPGLGTEVTICLGGSGCLGTGSEVKSFPFFFTRGLSVGATRPRLPPHTPLLAAIPLLASSLALPLYSTRGMFQQLPALGDSKTPSPGGI